MKSYWNPTKDQIRERLLEVKRRILAEPETYDQSEWCGTACCIAGHLVAVVGDRAALNETCGVARAAVSAIGRAHSPWLFSASLTNGPAHIARASRLDREHTGRISAQTGAMAIDAYLEEQGIRPGEEESQ